MASVGSFLRRIGIRHLRLILRYGFHVSIFSVCSGKGRSLATSWGGLIVCLMKASVSWDANGTFLSSDSTFALVVKSLTRSKEVHAQISITLTNWPSSISSMEPTLTASQASTNAHSTYTNSRKLSKFVEVLTKCVSLKNGQKLGET